MLQKASFFIRISESVNFWLIADGGCHCARNGMCFDFWLTANTQRLQQNIHGTQNRYKQLFQTYRAFRLAGWLAACPAGWLAGMLAGW
jgi:hypothetical protein